MRLSDTDKLLLERGWNPHGHNLWTIDIGGLYYAYNTKRGILTKQKGYTNNDAGLPEYEQSPCDFATVLALGFSDYWHEPDAKMTRAKMRLEHVFHM